MNSSSVEEKTADVAVNSNQIFKCHFDHQLHSHNHSSNIKCCYCNIPIDDISILKCDKCLVYVCTSCSLLTKERKWNFKQATDFANLLVENKERQFLFDLGLLLTDVLNVKKRDESKEASESGKNAEMTDLNVIFNEWQDKRRMKTLLMIAIEAKKTDAIKILLANDVELTFLSFIFAFLDFCLLFGFRFFSFFLFFFFFCSFFLFLSVFQC